MNRDKLQLYIGIMLDTPTDWLTRREAVTSAASNFDNLSYGDRSLTLQALANVLTRDRSSRVRYEAASAFAFCCHDRAVQAGFRELAPLVHVLLNDTTSRVRCAAARGLEPYSEKPGRQREFIQQVFRYALNDPSPAVSGIAEHVIGLGKTRD